MSHDQKCGPRFRVVRPRVLQFVPNGSWYGRLIEISGDYSELGPFATREEAARELVQIFDVENVDGYMGDEGENLEEAIHEDQAAWYEWSLKEKVVDELSDEFVAKFARKKK